MCTRIRYSIKSARYIKYSYIDFFLLLASFIEIDLDLPIGISEDNPTYL